MNLSLIAVLLCEMLLILFAVYLIISWISQTPFYPSSTKQLDKILENPDVNLPEHIRFVDIGSGDGRFVIWAARKGFSAEGIEYNPFLSMWSKFMIFVRRLHHAKIHNADFYKHDFSKYNFAYMYIFSEHMDKIKDKLMNEMEKGSIIITNAFKFKDLEADAKIGKYNIYYVK
jgi:hypothetical protein